MENSSEKLQKTKLRKGTQDFTPAPPAPVPVPVEQKEARKDELIDDLYLTNGQNNG